VTVILLITGIKIYNRILLGWSPHICQ